MPSNISTLCVRTAQLHQDRPTARQSGVDRGHNPAQSCQVWPFRGQKTNLAFFKIWLASKFLIICQVVGLIVGI